MKFTPACINTDDSFSNRKTCTCGSSVCDATKGLFCDASSSRCSKWKPGTDPGDSCTGCEDLLGTFSGRVWVDDQNQQCDKFARDHLCPQFGANDIASLMSPFKKEGAANDKW